MRDIPLIRDSDPSLSHSLHVYNSKLNDMTDHLTEHTHSAAFDIGRLPLTGIHTLH